MSVFAQLRRRKLKRRQGAGDDASEPFLAHVQLTGQAEMNGWV